MTNRNSLYRHTLFYCALLYYTAEILYFFKQDFHQQKDNDLLKTEVMISTFSNKIFFN